MSSSLRVRKVFRNFVVTTLFSAWTRSNVVGAVVRKCATDRNVLEVMHRFRQAFFKPKRSLLLTVTAAYKSNDEEEDPEVTQPCEKNITDLEMQALLQDLDAVEELARRTMYCPSCAKRVTFDKKSVTGLHCQCKDVDGPEESYDGWEPYMEADDVIIWRKEYKPGQGLYAYKVYGRYSEIRAQDFAAIQIDGAYRQVWDKAVAALSVVERQANGVLDQSVLHWEVLWPRLFANRDYVYIRRHKEYDVKSTCLRHKEGLFNINDRDELCNEDVDLKDQTVKDSKLEIEKEPERPNVHSNAKRKSQEQEKEEKQQEELKKQQELKQQQELQKQQQELQKQQQELQKQQQDNSCCCVCDKKQQLELQKQQLELQKQPAELQKHPAESQDAPDSKIYVIVSKSCVHPQVPETRNAIRVTEYWSHMVIKTLHGPNERGTEFVLTYYDEPAVGGLPSAISAFATARGAPVFLARMREAAINYTDWREKNHQDAPDFRPFGPETVSYEDRRTFDMLKEQEMESSKLGPDLEGNGKSNDTKEQSTQTETDSQQVTPKISPPPEEDKRLLETSNIVQQEANTPSIDTKTPEHTPKEAELEKEGDGDSEEEKKGWFRNLYPFYYFV